MPYLVRIIQRKHLKVKGLKLLLIKGLTSDGINILPKMFLVIIEEWLKTQRFENWKKRSSYFLTKDAVFPKIKQQKSYPNFGQRFTNNNKKPNCSGLFIQTSK